MAAEAGGERAVPTADCLRLIISVFWLVRAANEVSVSPTAGTADRQRTPFNFRRYFPRRIGSGTGTGTAYISHDDGNASIVDGARTKYIYTPAARTHLCTALIKERF